jgi:N-acetyl-1-D-myo-inositol-2-amino-2-deoxy-alpha-D-glucopyranoside deacetylase
MTPGGLLVVTAHPDDEVLIAGGTLAACAQTGLATGVVCLTRGEDGPIGDPALATRETLPRVRVGELRAACEELGVKWVKCYRRQDGNLRWSDGSAIVRQLAVVIDARRPDAVITFGEEGLYWHPDHIATYRFTRRALERVPNPPRLYRAIWPGDLMPALVAELRRRALPTGLWDIEPGEFGSDDDERDGEIVLDVRAQLTRKLSALRCHRTQLGPDHALTSLPEDLAAQFLGFVRFARVGASDGIGLLADLPRTAAAHA